MNSNKRENQIFPQNIKPSPTLNGLDPVLENDINQTSHPSPMTATQTDPANQISENVTRSRVFVCSILRRQINETDYEFTFTVPSDIAKIWVNQSEMETAQLIQVFTPNGIGKLRIHNTNFKNSAPVASVHSIPILDESTKMCELNN